MEYFQVWFFSLLNYLSYQYYYAIVFIIFKTYGKGVKMKTSQIDKGLFSCLDSP